jgi:hypothetical protein
MNIEELRVGIEPDSTCTFLTWPLQSAYSCIQTWSGQRGSNSRPTRWQRVVLPLNYARIVLSIMTITNRLR